MHKQWYHEIPNISAYINIVVLRWPLLRSDLTSNYRKPFFHGGIPFYPVPSHSIPSISLCVNPGRTMVVRMISLNLFSWSKEVIFLSLAFNFLAGKYTFRFPSMALETSAFFSRKLTWCLRVPIFISSLRDIALWCNPGFLRIKSYILLRFSRIRASSFMMSSLNPILYPCPYICTYLYHVVSAEDLVHRYRWVFLPTLSFYRRIVLWMRR